MPSSLKTKLSKLRFKGQITNEEYQEIINKLAGHDSKVREDERIKAIDECKQLTSSILNYYRDEYHFGATFNGMCNTIIDKFDGLKEWKGDLE